MESYNFDKVGKNMPYRVPETFFIDVEQKIISRARSARRRRISGIVCRSVAVAAAFALLIVAADNIGLFRHATDFAEIAQAFDSLSESDQTYLIETFQDDIFINP